MNPAAYSRRMQFRSGPQSSVFYACADHSLRLLEPANCHYPVTAWPMQAENPDDEQACDFCREEAL